MRWLMAVGAAFLVAPVLYARLAPPIVYMDNWPDGAPKVRAVSHRTIDGEYVFEGPYVAYHRDGSKEREGEFDAGMEHGRWTWWYASGAVRAECEFDHGSGDYTSYHADGRPWWQGRFVKGQRDGEWREYHPDGRLAKQGSYLDGLADGEWMYWTADDPPEHYTGRWRRGVLLEEVDDGVPVSATTSPRTPWPRHAAQSLYLLLLLLAPLPLVTTLALGERQAAFDPEAKPDPEAMRGSEATLDPTAARGPEATLDPTAARGPETVLTLLVGWACVQTALALVLGVLHLLRAEVVFVAQLSMAVGGMLAWRRRAASLPAGWSRGVVASGGRDEARGRDEAGAVAVAAVVFALVVVGGTLAWSALRSVTFNFDSLAYHLPTVAHWYQSHSLEVRPELGPVARYAFGWELLSTLFLMPYGEDLAVLLPNLAAWCALGLSVHVLARRLGASSLQAVLGAATLLTLPVVLERTLSVQPDLPLAAFFLAALVLGGLLAPRAEVRPIPLALALALVLGSKLSGLVYVVLAALLLAFQRRLVRRVPRDAPPAPGPSSSARSGAPARPAWLRWGSAALIVGIVGGFWYLRNLVDVGNPLGAVRLDLFGRELLPGTLDPATLRQGALAQLFDPTRSEHWRLLRGVASTALGPALWPLLALAAVALVDVARPRASYRRRGLIACGLALLTFLAYWTSPYGGDNGRQGYRLTSWMSTNVRFAFPWFGALAVLAAAGLRALRLDRSWLVVLPVVACVWGVTAVVEPAFLAVAIVVALALAVARARGVTSPRWMVRLGPSGASVGRLPGMGALATMFLLALVAAVTGLSRERRDVARRDLYGTAYQFVQDNFGPEDVIGYAMTQQRYPYYGRALDRRVVSAVPFDDSYEGWLDLLRREEVRVLVVGTTTASEAGRMAHEDIRPWLEREDSPFELLHGYESQKRDISVYSVRWKEP